MKNNEIKLLIEMENYCQYISYQYEFDTPIPFFLVSKKKLFLCSMMENLLNECCNAMYAAK